jgi:hypothetical protein
VNSNRPVWICDECGKPLEGDDGTILVNYNDIDRFDEGSAVFDERYRDSEGDVTFTAAAFDELPRKAPWHVLHNRHGVEDRYPRAYPIDSGRFQTWADVAAWSGHLMGKRWFASTAWAALLRRGGASL